MVSRARGTAISIGPNVPVSERLRLPWRWIYRELGLQLRNKSPKRRVKAKPTDNAFIEAFNGRFRAECLNAHWFLLRMPRKKWRIGADTTMKSGPMGRSATDRRFCCKTTSAPPARQRD